jgi:hypothetical protein
MYDACTVVPEMPPASASLVPMLMTTMSGVYWLKSQSLAPGCVVVGVMGGVTSLKYWISSPMPGNPLPE